MPDVSLLGPGGNVDSVCANADCVTEELLTSIVGIISNRTNANATIVIIPFLILNLDIYFGLIIIPY
jgi:hypothetical protein